MILTMINTTINKNYCHQDLDNVPIHSLRKY